MAQMGHRHLSFASLEAAVTMQSKREDLILFRLQINLWFAPLRQPPVRPPLLSGGIPLSAHPKYFPLLLTSPSGSGPCRYPVWASGLASGLAY